MKKVTFEWDENKNQENQEKHNVPFEFAQYAFADPNRVIAEDLSHSQNEKRYYCFGERYHYCTFHISWQFNTYYWCRVLAEREENLCQRK